MLEILIDGLERDRDIVLARLLKAATRVRQLAIGEEAAVVNGFLQQFVGIIRGVGASAGTAFLQTVLEDLMRRDELDEDELQDEDEREDEDELEIDESGNDASLASDLSTESRR